MYLFFIKSNIEEITLPSGYVIKRRRPFLNKHDVLWQILSFYNYFRWSLNNSEGVEVCYCYTINKIFQFPFMDKHGIHIGPCATSKKYRGQGFYPLMLKYISSKYEGRIMYMIVNENNKSSIRGVEKAGFKQFATGRRDVLFRYCIK